MRRSSKEYGTSHSAIIFVTPPPLEVVAFVVRSHEAMDSARSIPTENSSGGRVDRVANHPPHYPLHSLGRSLLEAWAAGS